MATPQPVSLPFANYDAFGRQRVSAPHTIWESKLLHDAAPLLWDDQQTAGSGTAVAHSSVLARVRMSVSSATAGTRTRQTFRRFNYQSGKSQLVFATYVMGDGVEGITKRVGLFDDNNGFYVEQSGSSFGFGIRSKVSGSVIDTFISCNDWNIRSGFPITFGQQLIPIINPAFTNIFVLDYEWLGTGTVRYGFVMDGIIQYFHQQHHANRTTGVYISTPNLPMRYEIAANGSNTEAAFLDQICNTVISEGGFEETGVIRWAELASSRDATSTDSIYPVMGVRLKATALDQTINLEAIELLGEDTGNYSWYLLMNPTVASTGTLVVTNETNSDIQTLRGTSVNTLSGGTYIDGGFFTAGQVMKTVSISEVVQNALRLGANIAGTPDEIWLGVRGHAAGLGYRGSIQWREL